jgi:hypothetical protein
MIGCQHGSKKVSACRPAPHGFGGTDIVRHEEVAVGQVHLHMSMSLDGYVAGPDVSVEHPLGVGGERLHRWIFADPPG